MARGYLPANARITPVEPQAALIPTARAIGVTPLAAIAAFPAVSAPFILLTYPTLLAAVQMDDTGTTQIGRGVFNHPCLVPGLINITIAVALGSLFDSVTSWMS